MREILLQPLINKIFRLSKRLLISHEEAQDATQEVIFKILKNSKTAIENNEAFILIMTKNYCLDILKSKRSQNSSLNESNDFLANVNLSQEIESKDSYSIVEKIIESLPNQQKIVVQLREIEQKEYEEIATIMEMNEAAVRMQLSRARKTIKESFEKINNYGV